MEIKVNNDPNEMGAELRSLLKQGEVRFLFKKKSDETVRYARGTTNTDLFDYTFKGSKRKKNDSVIEFFDLDKGEWRSCKIENLILILNG